MLRKDTHRYRIIILLSVAICVLAAVSIYQANEISQSKSELDLVQNKLDKKSQEYEWLSEITGDLIAGKPFPEVERTEPFTGT